MPMFCRICHAPRQGGYFRLRPVLPHHSSADTAFHCRWIRIPQRLLLKSVGGREKVSLSPAHCRRARPSEAGSERTWIAPAHEGPSSRRLSRRLPLLAAARGMYLKYRIFSFQGSGEGKNNPFIYHYIFGAKRHGLQGLFQNFF